MKYLLLIGFIFAGTVLASAQADSCKGRDFSRKEWLDSTVSTPDVITAPDLEAIIYPNPSSKSITIKATLIAVTTYFKITLSDEKGAVLEEKKFDEPVTGEIECKFDISKLASGVYFISINDGKNIFRKKFVSTE